MFNVNRVIWGMGILIGVYLVGRFGGVFDRLFTGRGSSTGIAGFIQEETTILQGNSPYPVFR